MTLRDRPKIGSVVQFALPDGRYAYGRVLRDASVAFYRATSSRPANPPIGSRDFSFVVGVYDDILTGVTVVGHDPSQNPDEDWPPPQKIQDPLTGAYSIYYKGQMRPATRDETAELETAAVWDYHHLMDRLTKITRD